MKYQLFSYRASAGPRAGMLVGENWIDLAHAAQVAGLPAIGKRSVDDLLQCWGDAQADLRKLASAVVEKGRDAFAEALLDSRQVRLLTPVVRPGAIYAAGANYRDHVEAMARAFKQKLVLDPKEEGVPPFHFLKAGPATLRAHGEEVRFPPDTLRLDWEAELAVVIGRHASAVAVASALEHVAGYMCANDLSSRDHLVRENVDLSSAFRYDWVGAKCFNGSCPLGPVFTPAEFVGSPENLDIKLWVNGEIKQDSNTRHHIFSAAEQIAYLSTRIDLYPGDIILTGTPAGAGMESGTFLKRGDVTKVWIQGLGALENRIV